MRHLPCRSIHDNSDNGPFRVSFDDGVSYWWEYPSTDCPLAADNVNATANPGQPISVYINNCLNTPGCFGFNTNGLLKGGRLIASKFDY